MITRKDIKWAWGNIRRSRRRRNEAKRHNIPVCSRALLLPHKKSSTLFVLGSASTINDLTEHDWKYISSCDSIGLNFWPIHSFVPTFYMFELPRDEGRRGQLLAYLENRRTDYGNVPKIFSEGLGGTTKNLASFLYLFPKLCVLDKTNVPINNKYLTSRYTNWSERLGLIDHLIVPSIRASIVRAVLIGAGLGYSKIVLVGVELNNTNYFWESWGDINIETGQVESVHKTVLPEIGEVTADVAIDLVDEKVLQPRKISLEVSSRSSMLYPRYSLCQELSVCS